MSDMKLIMENWRKFSESKEEVNEAIDPMTIAAIGMFATALLKPPNIHQGVYIGPRVSLASFSLKELVALAGLGALARGGVGRKLKGLWSRLSGGDPQSAEEVSDSLDAVTDGEDPEGTAEDIQNFVEELSDDQKLEKALGELIALIDSGEGSEEKIKKATDKVNLVLAAIAEKPDMKAQVELPHAGVTAEDPDGRLMYAKS